MNEELLQQMYDLNKAMGEAGGIAFCKLYGTSTDEEGVRHTVEINVTARDLNSTFALRQLMETIKFAREEYKMKPYQPGFGYVSKTAPKPVEPVGNSDPFPAVQNAPKPAVQEAAKPAVQTNPSTNRPVASAEGLQTFHCCKFAAGPYKNNIKIDWYTDNIPGKTRYPYLTSYIPVEQAMAWLQPFGQWEADDFYGNKEFPISLNISWKDSTNKNSKGNPYKDIVKIEAA